MIEISEEDYKEVFKIADWQSFPKIYMNFNDHLCYAIATGTPLPEHHGAVKDTDKIVQRAVDTFTNNRYERAFTAGLMKLLDEAPTIIPATEGEKQIEKSCDNCKNRRQTPSGVMFCDIAAKGKGVCFEYDWWEQKQTATKEGE